MSVGCRYRQQKRFIKLEILVNKLHQDLCVPTVVRGFMVSELYQPRQEPR